MSHEIWGGGGVSGLCNVSYDSVGGGGRTIAEEGVSVCDALFDVRGDANGLVCKDRTIPED